MGVGGLRSLSKCERGGSGEGRLRYEVCGKVYLEF